jgi:DHA1 family bicyclomycin/chloramphenicol resistance-like MFS transporter
VGPFLFLAVLGAALWVACWALLPESLPVNRRQPFYPNVLMHSYVETLVHTRFVLLCLAMALAGGGFLLYVGTASDVVLNILKLGPTQFGWMFGPIVSGLIIGSVASSRMAGRVSGLTTVSVGFGIMALGAVINLVVNFPTVGVPVVCKVFPLSIYTFGFALVAPVLTIQSLDLFPTRRGLASSMQGFSHVLVFALISGLAASMVYGSGLKHAVGLVILMGASVLAFVGSRLVNPNPDGSGPRPPTPMVFNPIPDGD